MGSLELQVQVEVHANVICILSNFNLQIYIHTTTALKMAHIRGESDIRMQQSSTNSSMSSSQQSSFSSNVNRSSASSSTARYIILEARLKVIKDIISKIILEVVVILMGLLNKTMAMEN